MEPETRHEFRARRLRQGRQRVILLGLLLGAGLLAYVLHLSSGREPVSAATQLSEGLHLVAAAQRAVADYALSNRAYPTDNPTAGLPVPDRLAGDYVESVAVDRGFVVITFRSDAHPRLRGRRLTLIPDVRSDGSLAWGCDASELDGRDLPTQCERARPRTP